MKSIYKLFYILLFALLLLNESCNTTEPALPNNGTLSISLIDASCTEAWIELKSNSVAFPVDINILTNGNTVAQLSNLHSSDTTIYIDSLLPNKTYNIQAIIPPTNQFQTTSSNKLTVQTLDTTSNSFTWQTYSFGDPTVSSCTLNDVAIIDDNDIWAVGEIYMRDSTGQPDPLPYNAVHWDGSNWKVKRITTEFRGDYVTVPLEGVFAFSSVDIWMVGSLPIHGDGINWTMYDVRTTTDPNLSLSKVWGSNSNNTYFVGLNGSIAHYNGNKWQKIESGTTTRLNDIWGYYNQVSSNLSVMTVASNVLQQGEYRLLAVSDNTAKDTLNWPYTDWLTGIWFKDKYSPVYISGGGIKQYHNGSWTAPNLNNITTECISGSDVNDVMAAGDLGVIFHFNGVGWKEIDDFLYQNMYFSAVRYKGNTVALVGFSTNRGIAGQGIIVIGKH